MKNDLSEKDIKFGILGKMKRYMIEKIDEVLK